MSSNREEKQLESHPTLESEINAARINALELKLETLSIITESMWNVLKDHQLEHQIDLKTEMAKVIDNRQKRSQNKHICEHCGATENATSNICSQCNQPLNYPDEISPFDY